MLKLSIQDFHNWNHSPQASYDLKNHYLQSRSQYCLDKSLVKNISRLRSMTVGILWGLKQSQLLPTVRRVQNYELLAFDLQ